MDTINRKRSPIEYAELEYFLKNKLLNFRATLDKQEACASADFVIIAIPTDCYPCTNYFNIKLIEPVISDVMATNPSAVMFIKSTVPVGCAAKTRDAMGKSNLMFSQSFCVKDAPFTAT